MLFYFIEICVLGLIEIVFFIIDFLICLLISPVAFPRHMITTYWLEDLDIILTMCNKIADVIDDNQTWLNIIVAFIINLVFYCLFLLLIYKLHFEPVFDFYDTIFICIKLFVNKLILNR